MIRGLKILGDFSLATFDRGLNDKTLDIKLLLPMVAKDQKSVNYEHVYYGVEANNKEIIEAFDEKISQKINKNEEIKCPLLMNQVHNKNKNLLFREFVHELVWMSHCLDPNCENPKASLQKLLNKIAPHLENLAKMGKSGMAMGSSDNVSENFSTSSKADKAITPHFKKVNSDLLAYLAGQENRYKKIQQDDLTIKLKDLLGYGLGSGVVADN